MMQTTFDKVILVTGGAGFIGSNYLNAMVPAYPNYRFVNVDALTYAGNLENIHVSGSPNYVFAKADIRDRKALGLIFDEYTPTHIVHFAAESHVDNSILGPTVFVETNVLGTGNLLELARTRHVTRFHHVSTDEVYGSLAHDDPESSEECVLLPNSPYSASKAGADLLVRSYHRTFGLNTVTTRASNNYGPNQHPEKLIPLFITNLLSDKQVPLYGNGKNVRDWIHVSDHVRGINMVFHGGRAGEIYNLGGGNEIENIDITKRLIALAGRDESAITHVADRLGHDIRYALNYGKALRELGWKPLKDFDGGLRETFAHYSEHATSGK